MSHEKARSAAPSDEILPLPGSGNAMLSDLLWEVSGYVELRGEIALGDLPITTASSGVLMTMYGNPGITVTEMARLKPRSQQAISQIVARLEKLGMLERRVGRGRSVELHLTDQGSLLAEQAFDRENAVDREVRELLGTDNYEKLRRLLVSSRDKLRDTQ
ncbi:MarR family transcriptional regulator [Amycolatopsis sp. NBC_00345]|uniref:MarR family winged helix-turn-helix transcriptional regulator n=1 Tax=Amycolatopsis sp. NBC_00345 TaxID=2975955 RepID=UPI002E26A37B